MTSNLTVAGLLLVSSCVGALLGIAISELQNRAATARELAKLKLDRQDALESSQRAMAHSWIAANNVCPACKTNDGRRRHEDGMVMLRQEYTDVSYVYCDDPFYWHAANCSFGTYGGIPQRDALLRIGKKLGKEFGKL